MPRPQLYATNAERQAAYRDRRRQEAEAESRAYHARLAEDRNTLRAAAELMAEIRASAQRTTAWRHLGHDLAELSPPNALRALAQWFRSLGHL